MSHFKRLKCTKFDFGWGSAPDPAGGGSLRCSPDSLAVFKGPPSKGTEGRGRKGRGRGRKGKEKGKGRGGERERKAFPLL